MYPVSHAPVSQKETIFPSSELASSEKVKQVVDRFIVHFSQEEVTSFALSKVPLLSDQDISDLKTSLTHKVVSEMQRTLQDVGSFFVLGQGAHNTVWGHPEYPQLVFKVTTRSQASIWEKVALKTVEKVATMDPCWVFPPRAAVIPVEGCVNFSFEPVSVYVEERLPIGLNRYEHTEFWARVMTHYRSDSCNPSFKTHIKKLIDQIQCLVEELGFDDAGFHNLPEICLDGEGIGITDFEGTEKENKQLVAKGLLAIAEVFVYPELVDKIKQKYNEIVPVLCSEYRQSHHIELKAENIDLTLTRASQRLVKLQQLLQMYDALGYTGSEPIPKPDLTSFALTEQKEVDELLERMQRHLEIYSKEPLTIRRCYWSAVIDQKLLELYPKILEKLKEQKVILDWSWSGYTFDIYF